MFDVSSIVMRYFPIRLVVPTEDGSTRAIELEVEPPKLKYLRKLMSVAKKATAAEDGESVMDTLSDAVRGLLNKNKSRYKVPDRYIDELNIDQLLAILTAYFEWVDKAKKNDPN